MTRILASLLALFLAATSPAFSATLPATPATLGAVLKAATGGDMIVLAPGAYPGLNISNRTFSPDLVIDASAATLVAWQYKNTSGVKVIGGTWRSLGIFNAKTNAIAYGPTLIAYTSANLTFDGGLHLGPGTEGVQAAGYGLRFIDSKNVKVTNAIMIGFRTGLTADLSDALTISESSFSRMSSDGVVFGQSKHVKVRDSLFYGTNPAFMAHPDAVQLLKGAIRNQDIELSGNIIRGPTQGLFGGPADGLLIVNNDVEAGFPRGISILDVTNGKVMNNRVTTYPGSKFQSRVLIEAGTSSCGNSHTTYSGKPAFEERKCTAAELKAAP